MSDSSDSIDIHHLARLARLLLDAEAQSAAQTDLKNIIAMIDQMQAIDTSSVEPMAHPLDATQRLRADVVDETPDRRTLQGSAPATQDGYYLVPRVVE